MNDICRNCEGFIFEVDRDPEYDGGILWSHLDIGCDDPTPRFTQFDLEIISIALEEWETDCTEAQRDLVDEEDQGLDNLENIAAIVALSSRVDQMIGRMQGS
jgi:hypothetical protein